MALREFVALVGDVQCEKNRNRKPDFVQMALCK